MLKCGNTILWKRNNFGTMIFGFRLYQTLSHDYSQRTRDLWLDSLQLCNDGLNFGLISKIFISRFLFTQNHEGVHTYILGSWRTDDVTHKNQLWIFVRKWRPSVYKIRILFFYQFFVNSACNQIEDHDGHLILELRYSRTMLHQLIKNITFRAVCY